MLKTNVIKMTYIPVHVNEADAIRDAYRRFRSYYQSRGLPCADHVKMNGQGFYLSQDALGILLDKIQAQVKQKHRKAKFKVGKG